MDDWEYDPLCGNVHSASVDCMADPWADEDPFEAWATYRMETGRAYA